MTVLTFTSICRNNQLIILDALPSGEMRTGWRLREDILDFCNQINRPGYCDYHRIESRQMLYAVLRAVHTECRAGVLFPVLHFECHGDPDKGLYIGPSKEYVAWPELIRLIADINAATRNNTGVVLASCYGFEISKHVSFTAPSPFNFVVAAHEEITVGQLQDVMLAFYKEPIATGDLSTGLAALDARMKPFISAEWFYRTFATFMVMHFNAAGRAEIAEGIVSSQVAKAGYVNRALVQAARARAKKFVKTPQTYYRYATRLFLHNKVPVSYEEFHSFVESKRPR